MLVVEDEAAQRCAIRLEIGELCEIVEAPSFSSAVKALRRPDIGAVLLDLTLSPHRGDPTGIDLLPRIRKRFPDIPVIVLTAHRERDLVVAALDAGADDYVTKPPQREDLLKVVPRLSSDSGRFSSASPDVFVGRSTAIRNLRKTAHKVASTNLHILIRGETGSGKDALARFIHSESSLQSAPFIATNCAAISSELLESTFFGHEKGSFTGAVSKHVGLIERADGGALFLDEICSMPLHLQGKLLRAIETGEYEPVGSSMTRNSRFRVIAATNADLHQLVDEGEFREDLLYRLNSVEMHIPPLRERPEDIPLLINWYLGQQTNNPSGKAISRKARAILAALGWPGNVRQLLRTLDSMLALSEQELLEPDDIPDHVLAATAPRISELGAFEQSLRDFERGWIQRALENTRGNVTRAAKLLGIGRLGLHRRMRRLEMEAQR